MLVSSVYVGLILPDSTAASNSRSSVPIVSLASCLAMGSTSYLISPNPSGSGSSDSCGPFVTTGGATAGGADFGTGNDTGAPQPANTTNHTNRFIVDLRVKE